MNINFNDLEKIIALAERSNIQSLEVVDGDQRISVVCQAPTNAVSATNPSDSTQKTSQPTPTDTANPNQTDELTADSEVATVVAPMMGNFYLRSEPDADVFVDAGDTIEVGDTLCVIEAMKIMHEVKAETAGVVVDILVNDGDVVDFGQPLFKISSDS